MLTESTQNHARFQAGVLKSTERSRNLSIKRNVHRFLLCSLPSWDTRDVAEEWLSSSGKDIDCKGCWRLVLRTAYVPKDRLPLSLQPDLPQQDIRCQWTIWRLVFHCQTLISIVKVPNVIVKMSLNGEGALAQVVTAPTLPAGHSVQFFNVWKVPLVMNKGRPWRFGYTMWGESEFWIGWICSVS